MKIRGLSKWTKKFMFKKYDGTMNAEQLKNASKVFNDGIKKVWDNHWLEGFNAATKLVIDQLDSYESNDLAKMNCWELIEKIKEDIIAKRIKATDNN